MHDTCMATKTITIDLQAYEALKRRKGRGDSFSDVIKRHFGGVTGRDLHHLLDRVGLDEGTLDRLDEVVGERQGHPARVASL
jgi:predicted CopG family antitoxin